MRLCSREVTSSLLTTMASAGAPKAPPAATADAERPPLVTEGASNCLLAMWKSLTFSALNPLMVANPDAVSAHDLYVATCTV